MDSPLAAVTQLTRATEEDIAAFGCSVPGCTRTEHVQMALDAPCWQSQWLVDFSKSVLQFAPSAFMCKLFKLHPVEMHGDSSHCSLESRETSSA